MAVVNTALCDWRDGKSVSECMIYMLENKIMCDVTFQTGKEKTNINAHKYMLSSRSPVFFTMFEGSLPEKREINIPEIETSTFQTLLRYIYSDEINISNDNVEEIVYAADKYMVAGLKRECEKVLKKTATTEHAAKTLQIARTYNLTALQQESLKFIESNTKICLSSDHALKLPRESLEIILQSDFLDCTETDICSFFLDWAKEKCRAANLEPTGENLRKAAGAMLYLIRFPVVDMKYFSNEVSKSGLIGPDEIVSIYQSHFGDKCKLFVNKPRSPVAKRATYELSRYGSINDPWNIGGIDALCFITDTDIWIKGVTIFYPVTCNQNMAYDLDNYGYVTDTSYDVVIQILDETNKEVNASTTQIPYSAGYGYGEVNHVPFPTATLVPAGHKYTLQMTGLPVQTYFGQECKDSVSGNGVTIKFKNSPKCTNGTTTQIGQFGGILFSV